MGTAETNPSGAFNGSLTARNEHQRDLFEYWSVRAGWPRPVNDQFSLEAARRISEAERLFPTIKDEHREAEDNENRVLRTVELVMFVLETCNVAPSRQYFSAAWKKYAPMSKIINAGKSAGDLQLKPMEDETIKNLSDELDQIEVMAYLHGLIVERVTQAARFQSEYGYLENQRLRQLTSRFVDQGKPKGRAIPDISETDLKAVPCLRQLKALENKVIGTATKRRAEEVLRILIAQQEGIELPKPPTEISSVE